MGLKTLVGIGFGLGIAIAMIFAFLRPPEGIILALWPSSILLLAPASASVVLLALVLNGVI